MEAWVNAFLALFAIVNPLGNLPFLVELVEDLDAKTRWRLFNIAAVCAASTLVILTLCGQWIMDRVFHIQMAEFKIAGGILLTALAIRHILLAHPHEKAHGPHNVLDLGAVPIAVPLLVGPGALITAILILNRDGPLVAYTSIAAVFAVTWAILQSATVLHKVLGRIGSLAMSRILHVFICAIGAHFLTSGIRELFLKPGP